MRTRTIIATALVALAAVGCGAAPPSATTTTTTTTFRSYVIHTCNDGRTVTHHGGTSFDFDGSVIEVDPGPGEFQALCGDPL